MKKFLSFVLSLAMVLSMIPMFGIPAFAITEEPQVCDHTNWTAWSTATDLPTEAGSYYLTTDVALSATWNVPTGEAITTNLCLNGHVISSSDPDDSVITVSGAALNLYDCGATEHYFEYSASSAWNYIVSPNDAQIASAVAIECINEQTTIVKMTGGAITGGHHATYNGGGVRVIGGVLNMFGGTIAGNVAPNGGGIYSSPDSTVVLTGGIVTCNTATSCGGGLFIGAEMCFTEGTLITMADGTRKAIETLKNGDLVRVFDHENGKISSAKLYDFWKYPEKHGNVVALHFTNNIDVEIVYGHSFFEKVQNKYVSVTKDNVAQYVGHEFYNVDDARFEKLIGYDFIDGEVDTYTIATEYHLNCVANGMLSNEDGVYTVLTNIFEYGNNLKIDAEKKQEILKSMVFGVLKI